MVTTTIRDYWISSTAVSISLNAMGNSDYAQVGIAPNASIVAYVKGVIDYDNSHKCRTWKLVGSPTAFGDSAAKYVYVAIPRSSTAENQNAIVVFPSELIDIYGKNEAGEQKGSSAYYYIYLQGIISASVVGGVDTPREFTQFIDTGKLMSDDALMNNSDSEWYTYSTVTGRVSFLKEIIMESTSKFLNLLADSIKATTATITNLVLGGKTVTGVADENTDKDSDVHLVTPLGGKKFFLSKLEDDIAEGNLQFKGKLDVFGNFVVKSNATVEGNATVVGDLLVEEGKTGSKSFNTGLLGNGWRIGKDGAAEMDSLSLRKFLEVPEFRYNRISIRTGVQWQTFGGGIIEEVKELDATHGIIKLKLEDGEVGAIKKDDKCMGIFHNELDKSANSDHDNDDHHGNFAFKGFMTIYFLVTDYCDEEGFVVSEDEAGRKQYFKYELRSVTDSTWTDAHHPQASMSFAGYANNNDPSRQACIYSTTSYLNMLTGMTGWTYDGNNIALIYGDMNGFTITSKQGSVIQLEGHGIAFGNAYMWGNIQQFERDAFLVSQQALYMRTSDKPEKVLSDKEFDKHYTWSNDTVVPSPEEPYVYVYWKQTFSDGTTKNEGLSVLSFDSSVMSVVLNRQIVSVAISNWYDDEEATDNVSFDIVARAVVSSNNVPISSAEASSEIEGFSYTVELSEDKEAAIFHVVINGYIPKSVNGIEAEGNFVTFSLMANGATASASVSIADNRQGDNGISAPRTLYRRSDVVPQIPSDRYPEGWASAPYSGDFDLKPAIPTVGMMTPMSNYGFSNEENETGITFTSKCPSSKMLSCSWMKVTLTGKAGDIITIPYSFITKSNRTFAVITSKIPDLGYAPKNNYIVGLDVYLKLSESSSGIFEYTMKTNTDVVYVGISVESSTFLVTGAFSIVFGKLYSVTESLDEYGIFESWNTPVLVEGTKGSDGEQGQPGQPGERGEDGTSPVVLVSDVSSLTWPAREGSAHDQVEVVPGTSDTKIGLSMNIGNDTISSFSNITIDVDNYDGIDIDETRRSIDLNNGTFVLVPELAVDISTSAINKIITITATAMGYTRRTSISLTLIMAGTSVSGPQGIQGCVVRMCGQYKSDITYYNDSNRIAPRSGETARYIDVVQYENGGLVNYYERLTTNQGESGIDPTDSNNWKPSNKFDFIATDLLISKEAWIDYLTGKSFYVTDENGDVVAGMQSVDRPDVPMIFAGASKNDVNNASTRIYSNGHAVMRDLQLESTDAYGNRLRIVDGAVQIIDPTGNILTSISQTSPSSIEEAIGRVPSDVQKINDEYSFEDGDFEVPVVDRSIEIIKRKITQQLGTITASSDGGSIAMDLFSEWFQLYIKNAQYDWNYELDIDATLFVNEEALGTYIINIIADGSDVEQSSKLSFISEISKQPTVKGKSYSFRIEMELTFEAFFSSGGIVPSTTILPQFGFEANGTNLKNIEIKYENYLNKLFGNGFAYSRSSDNYFAYLDNLQPSQESMRFRQGNMTYKMQNQNCLFRLNPSQNFYNANPLVFVGRYATGINGIITGRTPLYNPLGLTMMAASAVNERSSTGEIKDYYTFSSKTYTFIHSLAKQSKYTVVCNVIGDATTPYIASLKADRFEMKFSKNGALVYPQSFDIMIYDCSEYQ